MTDLSTKYMGLNLKNPIIIGSSELTNSVNKIKALADSNAGAIVLKSFFEEQIMAEVSQNIYKDQSGYTDAYEYIREYTKEHNIDKYLDLIREAKKSVDIPIIASINCISDNEWISYAKKFEEAGADALELNIAILPSDFNVKSEDNEKKYFSITEKVKSQVNIPVSLKMSYFSAGLANLIQQLSYSGNVDSFVLFNRYYMPDVDIDKLKVTTSSTLSSPSEISTSLRWIALLSESITKDLVASTGVHDGNAVVKQILAGASAVQIVSAFYKKGPQYINTILKDIEEWMDKKGFANIEDFKGKLSYDKAKNPAVFERTQFMRYYDNVK